MKKQLSITIGCLLLMAGLTFGADEVISFDDNNGTANSGSYLPTATFSLDVDVSWTGYTGIGLSYWLQAPTALAPFLTGTGETYFSWSDPNQTFFGSDPFNGPVGGDGADPGYQNTGRDLGATSIFAAGQNQQVLAGGTTYQVSTLNFSLANAPAGTYVLRTLILSPKVSQITEGNSTTTLGNHPFPSQGLYTITIIPEPSTWSLIALGGLGAIGMIVLRRRQSRA